MPSIDDIFDKANSILDLIDPPRGERPKEEVEESDEKAVARPRDVNWHEFTSDDRWHVAVLFQKSLYQALCGEVSDIYDATLVEAPSKIQVCSRCLSTAWNRARK